MPFVNYKVSYIKKFIKMKDIIFDDLPDHIPFTNGKLNLRTGKFKLIVKEDYVTIIMGYEFNEQRNEDLINYYHKIYVDIFEIMFNK